MGTTVTDVGRPDVEAIWADVGSSLERFVRRQVSDPHAAEEVVAEVLAKIHEHLGAVDDHERVTAWVFRIARNAITDHYRRAGRRREETGTVDQVVSADSADGWLEDQGAVLSDLASCIRPLVDALPADYQRALHLTDLEGRTQADAARIEGISLSGMKSRVQRGRRLFTALVRECCEVTTDIRGEVVDFQIRVDGLGCEPTCDTDDCPPS